MQFGGWETPSGKRVRLGLQPGGVSKALSDLSLVPRRHQGLPGSLKPSGTPPTSMGKAAHRGAAGAPAAGGAQDGSLRHTLRGRGWPLARKPPPCLFPTASQAWEKR